MDAEVAQDPSDGSTREVHRYGPTDELVEAFIERLAALDDHGLWALENAIRDRRRHGRCSGRWFPDSRAIAEPAGRLLAWYEAGFYAARAVTPRDDDTVVADSPGEATNIAVPLLARLAPAVAQLLVVCDRLPEADAAPILSCWPNALLPTDDRPTEPGLSPEGGRNGGRR